MFSYLESLNIDKGSKQKMEINDYKYKKKIQKRIDMVSGVEYVNGLAIAENEVKLKNKIAYFLLGLAVLSIFQEGGIKNE